VQRHTSVQSETRRKAIDSECQYLLLINFFEFVATTTLTKVQQPSTPMTGKMPNARNIGDPTTIIHLQPKTKTAWLAQLKKRSGDTPLPKIVLLLRFGHSLAKIGRWS